MVVGGAVIARVGFGGLDAEAATAKEGDVLGQFDANAEVDAVSLLFARPGEGTVEEGGADGVALRGGVDGEAADVGFAAGVHAAPDAP